MKTIEERALFIFPGQGSQYVGMGKDIYSEFSIARKIYETASEIVGYDVAELSFEDPQEKLGLTEFTQVALLTHSISCLEVFTELSQGRIRPAVGAGHSLGEYCALVAAGSLNFEDALMLVRERGRLMAEYGKGKMVALSLDLETIRSFVNNFYCEVGGCNLPLQTVVGGEEQDLRRFVDYVKSKFRKGATPLKTEGAFHTFHMIAAAEKYRPLLDSVDLRPPRIKILSNFTGKYHSSDPASIKALLFFQLFNPVKWIWGMQHAFNDGVNLIVEFGGGIGGSSPNAMRPNLEGITKKALGQSKHHAVYLPAINTHTIRRSAVFVNTLQELSDGEDIKLGVAVDENWFNLFLPIENGILTSHSVALMNRVEELDLSRAVQMISTASQTEPSLELVVGCEGAAIIEFSGDDIERELTALKKRLEHPAYENLSMPNNSSDKEAAK